MVYSNQTKQLIAPMYFEGNTDTEIFNQWIVEFLIPELKPNWMILWDTLGTLSHKFWQKTRLFATNKSCKALTLLLL